MKKLLILLLLLIPLAGCDNWFNFSNDSPTSSSTPTPNPTVEISASATSGSAPLSVTLTAVVYGGQSPYQYLWEVSGVGKIGDRRMITYTFSSTGTYIVFLTVTDGYGRSAQAQIEITVS